MGWLWLLCLRGAGPIEGIGRVYACPIGLRLAILSNVLYPRRYPTLDGWRGIASLSVLLWHHYWLRTTAANGFWLGVQMFFVVSGYCIAAAVSTAFERKLTFRQFMKRRIRRIGIPYLGSLIVALAVRFGESAWEQGVRAALPRLHFALLFWVRNLTLTQWTQLTVRWLETGEGLAAPWYNPELLLGVHWSLNYEEQFYLIAGLLLLVATAAEARTGLVALTAGVAAINILWPGRITGLFVDYWLQFFCGTVVFLRLCKVKSYRAALACDLGMASVGIACFATALVRGDFPLVANQVQFYGQLAFCIAYGLLLIALRRFDQALSQSWPGGLLSGVGKFSYSLYLVHRPALDAFRHLGLSLRRSAGWAAADICVLALVMLFAYLFYLVFEKPFLNRSLDSAKLVVKCFPVQA